ncbi:hypothetical protein BVX94_00250 [bacterium B17]|nr:hypothetical protein BVX94_00250 [bacterium B17]
MKVSFKHRVEYAFVAVIYFIVNILPYRAALAVGAFIAAITHYIFRFRVEETKRRMRIVFGDSYNEKKIDRMCWIAWRNAVFNGVEMLRVPRMTPEWTRKVYDCEVFMNHVLKQCATGKGGIIASPHTGNWDMAGVACYMYNIPIFNIAAKQKNPLVNDFFNRVRSSPGIDTIERGTANMRSVLRKLKEGKVLALLPDSRMKAPDTELPLMGGKANLGKGIGFFARQADVPIFLCTSVRIGWARHRIQYLQTITPDKSLDREEDIQRIVRLAVEGSDKAIQDNPEQWFWFNKRWVLDPVE